MEVKVEVEQVGKFATYGILQVAKIHNLRNSVGCENLQPCKISVVAQIPSVCGFSFLPTSDAHLRVRLGFFMFKSAR